MKNDKNGKKHTGVLSRLKILMNRNRLGELMVLKGLLTPRELKQALSYQKTHQGNLGQILLQNRMVSRSDLYKTLAQQLSLRCVTALVTIFIGVAATGIKPVRAAGIKDIPAQIKLTRTANPNITPIKAYPALFGSEEKRSHNLDPFTKWTGMFSRFETAIKGARHEQVIREWHGNLQDLQGLPLDMMASRVNDLVNSQRYIIDSRNWGQSDYWETPVEFFTRGGDCEDFAIAKYASLRILGVPEERLRIAIVHDKQKNIPHAVLIVYTDEGAMVLDNQEKQMRPASRVNRYRPIFSINRNAWWLHSRPTATILASAE